ncbi:MAG: ABC transporter permease [Gammaproteobacteria bacterium]|jgi:phospholipid/cholesterol/gamma-HCH transport system permease protein|uniref:ABC transporter permease n=1 Tax=Methylotuvimicrobium sp. TaxID=2822413 RepID=UPI001DC6BC3D|nr:ABC transporter permease [Gammaproteobacteria bacterium]
MKATTGMTDIKDISGHIKFEQIDADTWSIRLAGSWTQGANIKPVEQVLAQLAATTPFARLTLQAGDLDRWDSRLPTYLLAMLDYCQAKNIQADLSGLPEGIQGLLNLARAVPERAGDRRSAQQTPALAKIGMMVLSGLADIKRLIIFIGETVQAGVSLMRGKARFRTVDLFLCIQETGPGALAIVTLISLLVGLILAFVGAVQLAMFGAQIFIADLVGLGTVREMGALMTAVIMSGRTGAAYAAQLGTMNVNSEIDALKTMGISPMEFLVLPRMLALILMLPLLCIYADFMGILGGAIVTTNAFDVSLTQYFNQLSKAVDLTDFSIGLFKSLVFAVLIATAGCMRGMQCGRSASAVGDAATAAVVNSIVYIVVADSIITLICNRLGI